MNSSHCDWETWSGLVGISSSVWNTRPAAFFSNSFLMEGSGWFLSYHCFTSYVRITWLNGSELDPPPPKTSKHEHVRYLDIHEGEEIDDRQLRDWIRQAASMPGEETF